MSYAKDLQKKLQLHKETDFVDLKEDFDEVLFLAENSVDEYESLEKELDDVKDEVKSQESQIDELKSEVNELEENAEEEPRNDFGLLGVQIREAFEEIFHHQGTNQIKLLEHLQKFTVNGYK